MSKPNDTQAEGEHYNKVYYSPAVEQSRETARSIHKQVSELQKARPAEQPQVCPNCTMTIPQLAAFWGGDKGMLKRISELELYSQDLEQQRDALQAQLAAAEQTKGDLLRDSAKEIGGLRQQRDELLDELLSVLAIARRATQPREAKPFTREGRAE